MCTMGLALGKDVKTDCSINANVEGRTYCFGNEEAKTMFMRDPKGNLAKADAYRSKRQAMPQGGLTPGQELRKELEDGAAYPAI